MEEYGGSAGGLRGGKFFTFDGGMKVPTIAMWKGKIAAAQINTDINSQLDWFPTFAAISGAELPKNVALDGIDISNVLLKNKRRKEATHLFLNGSNLTGFRKGDWKVKLPYSGNSKSKFIQEVKKHDTLLFNLKSDPGEKNNLYKQHKERAKNMLKEMNQSYTNMGKLPKSIVVRTLADNSHFDALEKKRVDNKK